MPAESTPTPQEAATASAIRNLQSEKDQINRYIAQKQARLEVIERQLAALQTGPAVTVAPVTPAS